MASAQPSGTSSDDLVQHAVDDVHASSPLGEDEGPELNASMPPPPEETYPSLALLKEAVQKWSQLYGYNVVIVSTTHGRKRVGCEHSGRTANKRKLLEENRLRKRTSTKTGCPFGFWYRAVDKDDLEGKWRIMHTPRRSAAFHNHDRDPPGLRRTPKDKVVGGQSRARLDARVQGPHHQAAEMPLRQILLMSNNYKRTHLPDRAGEVGICRRCGWTRKFHAGAMEQHLRLCESFGDAGPKRVKAANHTKGGPRGQERRMAELEEVHDGAGYTASRTIVRDSTAAETQLHFGARTLGQDPELAMLESTLRIVWQALKRTGSDEAHDGSLLWALLAAHAPTVVGLLRSVNARRGGVYQVPGHLSGDQDEQGPKRSMHYVTLHDATARLRTGLVQAVPQQAGKREAS